MLPHAPATTEPHTILPLLQWQTASSQAMSQNLFLLPTAHRIFLLE
ncbi:hypothetical protein LEMLEM_LOCUS15395 [Lemmus lemmus]